MNNFLEEFKLKDVLQEPGLLNLFENYLIKKDKQRNLLFVEAINQLRHEEDCSKEIEDTLF
ncbi:hypothetical protein BD560DRAFT_406243, partial [Blakeslea trispora]